MAIGRTGSFATVQPIKDSIGDAMTSTENAGFKYREEKRLADEAKAKKQEAELADMESFDKSIVPTITGYSSIDDPIISYVTEVKTKGADLTRQMNLTSDPYKKSDLKMQRNKLVQGISLLNQYPKILIEKGAEIAKGVLDGKYNPREVDAVTSIAKSVDSGKYKMYVDDNHVARIDIYDFDEETGKPTKVIEKGLSLGDLSNRLTPFTKSNYDTSNGIAQQIVSQYKQDKSTIEQNFTTTEKNIYTEKLDADLKRKALEVAKMPNEAFDAWIRMGNEPKRSFKENEIAEIADYLYDDLKGRYNNEIKSTVDYGSMLGFSKNRDEKEKEKKVTTAIVEIPPEFKKAGIIPRDGYKAISVTGLKSVPAISGVVVVTNTKTGKTKNQETTFSNATLNTYTVATNPNDGERAIAAIIDYPDIKSSTLKAKAAELQITLNDSSSSKEEKNDAKLELDRITKGSENKQAVVYLKEADAAKFGIQMDYDDVNQMKDAAGSDIKQNEQTETKGKWSNK